MECTVRWTGLSGMSFVAETGSGHLVTMDGAPDGGGRNLAPRPMEVVLAGTGGCTAYDVVVILRKSGQDIRGCDVTLIHFHSYPILSRASMEKARQLAALLTQIGRAHV